MNPYAKFQTIRPEKQIVAKEIDDFESILEVGCQWGENLFVIEDKFPDKKIIGVDIDKDIINEAQKYLSKAELYYGDIMNLPFETKSIDIVFTNALMCMLKPEQVEKALSEMMRVAKKHIILIELKSEDRVGTVRGGRTGANWNKILEDFDFTSWKIKEWDAEPWKSFGYFYKVYLPQPRIYGCN